jgi:hypothetical protein
MMIIAHIADEHLPLVLGLPTSVEFTVGLAVEPTTTDRKQLT